MPITPEQRAGIPTLIERLKKLTLMQGQYIALNIRKVLAEQGAKVTKPEYDRGVKFLGMDRSVWFTSFESDPTQTSQIMRNSIGQILRKSMQSENAMLRDKRAHPAHWGVSKINENVPDEEFVPLILKRKL